MKKEIYQAIAIAIFTAGLSACGGSNGDDPIVPSPNILTGSTYAFCDLAGEETSYQFEQDSSGIKTVQNYLDNNCLTPDGAPTTSTFSYRLGNTSMANDGLDASQFTLTITGNTLYTLIRLTGGALGISNLYFGDTVTSSAGLDGSSSALRHDGVDLTEEYSLQP